MGSIALEEDGWALCEELEEKDFLVVGEKYLEFSEIERNKLNDKVELKKKKDERWVCRD